MKGDEILFEKNPTIFIRKVFIFSTHAKTPWRCRLLCPHPVFHKSYRSLRVTRIPVTSWQTNNALTIFSVSFAVTRWGYRIPAINEDNAAASVQSPCRSQHFRILPCAFYCKDAGKNRIYMPIDWCRYIYTTLTWHKIWLLLIQSLMLMINKHKPCARLEPSSRKSSIHFNKLIWIFELDQHTTVAFGATILTIISVYGTWSNMIPPRCLN